MRPYLDPRDHAFANGPVFPRPASIAAARELFDDAADAERLMEVFAAFDRGADAGEGLRLGLGARLLTPNGERRARIGRDCALRGIIRCEDAGEVALGDRVYLGDDALISVRSRVEVGQGTLIAHGAQVFDNDTHPLDPAEREAHFRVILKLAPGRDFDIATAPVRIGARCWLGLHSLVMKGVAIGETSVVAAGAVVMRDAPPGVIVAGNPARVVRRLDGSGRRSGLAALFGGR